MVISLLLHRGGLGYLDNSYTDCIGQLKRPSWTEFRFGCIIAREIELGL
jgi:hypothetical protein